MKLFAVYSQYYPTHKCEPNLESLWTKLDVAKEIAEGIDCDYVWIEEVKVNSENIKKDCLDVYPIKSYDGTIAP